jgi:hypothetical protein
MPSAQRGFGELATRQPGQQERRGVRAELNRRLSSTTTSRLSLSSIPDDPEPGHFGNEQAMRSATGKLTDIASPFESEGAITSANQSAGASGKEPLIITDRINNRRALVRHTYGQP